MVRAVTTLFGRLTASGGFKHVFRLVVDPFALEHLGVEQKNLWLIKVFWRKV
jgi:hypothetical protein